MLRAAFISLSILGLAVGQAQAGKVEVYSAVGADLTRYDVDVERGTLTKGDTVTLPDNVQYAWPHPSKKYFYVAWSKGAGSDHSGVTAFRIDSSSGALRPHGKPISLQARPVHVTTDISGTHMLVAYPVPSGLTVYRIEPDGTIGSQVTQPAPLDVGIYAHQVRVDPSNKMVILVTRGNGPTKAKAEDPGALKIFGYADGVLTNRQSIAPGGGLGFQPRHLDFDGPWVFVSLERQSKLQTYKKLADGTLTTEPLFTKDSLKESVNTPRAQAAGTIHVHPNGRFVYQANRASGTTDFEGKPVFAGGENSIAVYSINQKTGEPTRIQNIDTRGMEPRTFAIDPSGRILVAANQNALLARDGQHTSNVPASLAVFRVGSDGKLEFLRKYDVETAKNNNLFWMGLVSLN